MSNHKEVLVLEEDSNLMRLSSRSESCEHEVSLPLALLIDVAVSPRAIVVGALFRGH